MGKSLVSTDAETLLESIHTDTVVTLEGQPSGEEHWMLLPKTQVPFPASTSQLFITPILREPMTSSGLCRHYTHGVYLHTCRSNTHLRKEKEDSYMTLLCEVSRGRIAESVKRKAMWLPEV